MEGNVERGQAAVLRGTVQAVQVAHGKAPGLPIPAQAEADVHRGRQEDADIRVQDADAAAAERDAAVVVQGRRVRSFWFRDGRGRAGRGRHQFQISGRRVHIADCDVLAGQLADVQRRQSRRGLGVGGAVIAAIARPVQCARCVVPRYRPKRGASPSCTIHRHRH